MNIIRIPGFTAEDSLYATKQQYRGTQGTGMRNGVTLAGTCTCTDPGCTWTCPLPPPPPIDDCDRCMRLSGCARKICFCECGGGICVGPCCRFCT